MKSLLDTSVLLGPRPDPIDGELAISAASIAELHFGVLVAGSPEVRAQRLSRLAMIERSFVALPIDARVAQKYGELAAATVAIGRQPRARVMDLLIAATAAAHGATLYTRNAADLAGLEGLLRIQPVS